MCFYAEGLCLVDRPDVGAELASGHKTCVARVTDMAIFTCCDRADARSLQRAPIVAMFPVIRHGVAWQ